MTSTAIYSFHRLCLLPAWQRYLFFVDPYQFVLTHALQWWNSILMKDRASIIWMEFKQEFSVAWLTPTFEVDMMAVWNKLDSYNCRDLDECTDKFWDAYRRKFI